MTFENKMCSMISLEPMHDKQPEVRCRVRVRDCVRDLENTMCSMIIPEPMFNKRPEVRCRVRVRVRDCVRVQSSSFIL